MLTLALRSLFAVSEAYPDLKASQNMLALQDELPPRRTELASRVRPTTTPFWNTTRPENPFRRACSQVRLALAQNHSSP